MKKILSILMAASMLLAAVPAMATTEGIIQGDIMMISETPAADTEAIAEDTEIEAPMEAIKHVGTLKEAKDNEIVVTIEDVDYSFILAEGVEVKDLKAGDKVEVTSTSPLATKDIKEATAVALVTEDAEVTEDAPSYYRHIGTVAEVAEGSVDVVIEEDMVVTFATTEATRLYTIDGEEAEAVAEDDMVIVLSKSPLMSRDIKEAAVIVVTNEESQASVYLDTFDMADDALLSADAELVLNMENAEEYAGKKLLVFYDFALMSLPAQTTPYKVVVLEDEATDEPEEEESVRVEFSIGDSMIGINGEMVEVEKPYIVGEGVTLVPIRVISESFGAEVNWDGETKTVTVKLADTEIIVTIDSKVAIVNGEEMELEEAPELTENGFTMIPLRFISEKLGAEVGYIHETQTITVEKN